MSTRLPDPGSMPTTDPGSTTVAVVGAGVSGVAALRALSAAGFDVTVFEKATDLGGVWSDSRRYPGISTQDDRTSYTFSGAPMPASVPQHPSGGDVRRYLESYLEDRGLRSRIRLRTAVQRAARTERGTWRVDVEGPDGAVTHEFDWLVAANGTFSTPYVPDWPGRAEFEAAGGVVVEPGALGDGDVLDGRRVAVVGWGKTGCDVAVVAAGRARSVDVVARTLTWKYPRRLGGGLTFHHLVLTRAGERIIGGAYRRPDGRLRLERVPERLPRQLIGRVLARRVDRAHGLAALGLRPALGFSASTSLISEGFLELVGEGRIRVHRDRGVARLGADEDGPWLELRDGTRVAADLVVAATGYDQTLGFIAPETIEAARTPDDALLFHHRILAVDVPRLAVIGWAHSYRSPLTSEVSAVWLAAAMRGRVPLPPQDEQRRHAQAYRLTARRLEAASTVQLPGVTIRDIDGLLSELGTPLPLRTRLRQLFRPFDPADYAAALEAERVVLAELKPALTR